MSDYATKERLLGAQVIQPAVEDKRRMVTWQHLVWGMGGVVLGFVLCAMGG